MRAWLGGKTDAQRFGGAPSVNTPGPQQGRYSRDEAAKRARGGMASGRGGWPGQNTFFSITTTSSWWSTSGLVTSATAGPNLQPARAAQKSLPSWHCDGSIFMLVSKQQQRRSVAKNGAHIWSEQPQPMQMSFVCIFLPEEVVAPLTAFIAEYCALLPELPMTAARTGLSLVDGALWWSGAGFAPALVAETTG
eukprot:CAMPEP_0170384562 /NCGR_PEP_ID=MMETSP0117_2-20130122/16062_1 /TAXON_ID=400756 /ORGANISM="Durinskia baltica, Strain CSIRO CS-38" /LENGTH=192 /DNA_ID=CAMNT_0010640315 /DNA_START=39 /DNA_END=613 /DNA_ORIENTATION=+